MPIRRADRLFDILRILRSAKAPVTAASIADELEVTVRTVYRDVATLQARRVPIEGAAGIGYVLRGGFDLPPLMFTEDEAEAIAVGVRMLARTGDPGLQKAAESVLSKVAQVVPDPLRDYLNAAPVYVATRGAPVPQRRDLPATIRHAIRDARKMKIAYEDEQGRRTGRVTISVYASHPPSPTTAQHSLPGGVLPPYRGRSFTGRIASASPDAPEPEGRIHLPPAGSPLRTWRSPTDRSGDG